MDEAWLAANLPVLGEPVPVELANTRYRDGDDVIDFLAGPALAAAWFAESPTASAITRPAVWTADGWRRLVHLRDVVDALLRAQVAGERGRRTLVDQLNRTARLLATHVELRWDAPGAPQAVRHDSAAGRLDAALGRIAADTIGVLGGPEADLLRVCANDDCHLLFVRHHHRRRWCHDSCGHRHRQAAYYRARKGAATPA